MTGQSIHQSLGPEITVERRVDQTLVVISPGVYLKRIFDTDRGVSRWDLSIDHFQYDITNLIWTFLDSEYLRQLFMEFCVSGQKYGITMLPCDEDNREVSGVVIRVSLPDGPERTILICRPLQVDTLKQTGREFIGMFQASRYDFYTPEQLDLSKRYTRMYLDLVSLHKRLTEVSSSVMSKRNINRGHLVFQFPGIKNLIFIPGNYIFIYSREEREDVTAVACPTERDSYEFIVRKRYEQRVNEALEALSKLKPEELQTQADIVGISTLNPTLPHFNNRILIYPLAEGVV